MKRLILAALVAAGLLGSTSTADAQFRLRRGAAYSSYSYPMYNGYSYGSPYSYSTYGSPYSYSTYGYPYSNSTSLYSYPTYSSGSVISSSYTPTYYTDGVITTSASSPTYTYGTWPSSGYYSYPYSSGVYSSYPYTSGYYNSYPSSYNTGYYNYYNNGMYLSPSGSGYFMGRRVWP